MTRKVVIAGAMRTPTGKLLGSLSPFTAPELGSFVVRGLVAALSIDPLAIDEVIMGNAIPGGIGQNPARQAALLAGLPDMINAFTVNKACASGMKATALGASAIMQGDAEAVIAGGMESMSNAPFLSRELRRGVRHGDSAVIDSMISDGLLDCYYSAHMGSLCEDYTVRKYSITREEQDSFALSSHSKAIAAEDSGLFRDEVVPVELWGRRMETDETIRRDTDARKLSMLEPAFSDNGTVTAGNSPGLNDGASAVLLTSLDRARSLGLKPLAEIIGWSSAHIDPKWYTIAPVRSVEGLLEKTGLKLDDFDLIEENEAFAAQTLAVIRELNLDGDRVNVHGGAIALGHPIGSSGSRIIVTLAHALRNRNKKLGLATICLGGGGAMSMAIRAL